MPDTTAIQVTPTDAPDWDEPIYIPQPLQTRPADAVALAKILAAMQSPAAAKGIQITITDSFNTTANSNNRTRHQLTHHPSGREAQSEKLSRLVGPIFAGFWLICMFVLITTGGNSHD